MTPARKAAPKRRKRVAIAKPVKTRKRYPAGAKAALARKRRSAGHKVAEARRQKGVKELTKGSSESACKVTPKEVAEWMVAQIEEHGQLLQVEAVASVEDLFGREFVYLSDIGEMSIDRRVLYQFRKLTENDVVWVTRPGGVFWEGAYWRTRQSSDASGRTQFEY